MAQPDRKHRGWSWWYLLFLVQFVAVLWPPFYNTADPSWAGMPFFYWYQLLRGGGVPADETVAADYYA